MKLFIVWCYFPIFPSLSHYSTIFSSLLSLHYYDQDLLDKPKKNKSCHVQVELSLLFFIH